MIRFILGLLLVMGVAGGIDNATDMELVYLLGIAGIGFLLMYFGSRGPQFTSK